MAAPVHRFSAYQKNLRDEWFKTVETDDDWEDLGPIGEGESQSIRVRNKTTGLIGVAKPGPAHGGQDHPCRAAHERLAFDLACLVPLPVSPVVLWRADHPNLYKRGRSISCWSFPQAMKWSVALTQGLISNDMKKAAAPIFAAMRVFHTLIGDTDRKGDHVFVDLNGSDNEPQLAFIDHAYSLSYGMRANWPPCGHYLPEIPEDHAVMRETAAEYGKIDDGRYAELVNRMPRSYLPDAAAQHILAGLLARKGNLCTLLGI